MGSAALLPMYRQPAWVSACVALGALAMGLVLGVADLHANEMIVTLAFLFGVNMVLSVLAPAGCLRWTVLSTIGILAVNWKPGLVHMASNPNLPRTAGSYLLFTVILLLDSLIGMAFGFIVRRSMQLARDGGTSGNGSNV